MPIRRAVWITAAAVTASVVFLAATLEFLAPDVSYALRDRLAERVRMGRGRTFRIALGATSGSNYRVGTILNRYLRAQSGYELDLVSTSAPGNVNALLDPHAPVDLAIIVSTDDDAVRAAGVTGVAALETQYFFVIVPRESVVQDVRDLAGPVNTGTREPGEPPTLGERVIDYYGLASARAAGASPRVSIVRPREGILADFRSGHMVAATRTQFLDSDLVANNLRDGAHRLVPIRDHEALARALPGTRPGFIPAGLYGPERREPAAPVPTITVRQLLVARGDVPGRVITDLLHVVYDPRVARDLRAQLTEASGRDVAGLALHPAADIFYRRNDLLTSDRLGRISFVASSLAALAAAVQFAVRFRRRERRDRTREAVAGAADRLLSLRQELQDSAAADVERVLREADTLLCGVEREAAAGEVEPDAVAALRSLHAACYRAADRRRTRDGRPAPGPAAEAPAPVVARDDDGGSSSTGEAHAEAALGHPDRAGAAG